MFILLEIEANLNSMKLGFDPDLGAGQTGEENHDTEKQISQIYFPARIETSNLACTCVIFLKPTETHSKC